MQISRKFLLLLLALVLGMPSFGLAQNLLPEGWDYFSSGNMRCIKNYPRILDLEYEVPRENNIQPTVAVLKRHKCLQDILPFLVTGGQPVHYFLMNNGDLYQWIAESYQSKTTEALNNYVITILVETPEGAPLAPGTESSYTTQTILSLRQDQALNESQISPLCALLDRIKHRCPTLEYLDDQWHATSLRDNIDLSGRGSAECIPNLDIIRYRVDLSPLTHAIVQQWLAPSVSL